MHALQNASFYLEEGNKQMSLIPKHVVLGPAEDIYISGPLSLIHPQVCISCFPFWLSAFTPLSCVKELKKKRKNIWNFAWEHR